MSDKAEALEKNWQCPITSELFTDPVICDDGHTYERTAIEMWLQTHNTSPLTNSVLQSKRLIPNIVMRLTIMEHLSQKYPKDHNQITELRILSK